MQDCSISIANALGILQFCTKPAIYCIGVCGSITKWNFVSLLKLRQPVLHPHHPVQFCLTTEITKTGTPYQHICPARTAFTPLFLELGIWSVFKVFMMKVAVVILNSYHGVNEIFMDVQNLHDRNIRKVCKNHVPFSSREIARKLHKYKAVKF